MNKSKGLVTIPTDVDVVSGTLELMERWGADALRDCDGTDFPQDLTPYDLIIHCGACMFNHKYVLSRIERAREQHIPMTNYGVAIAYLNGILDQIEY